MTDKKTPDWEKIEKLFRAGVLSVREIAAAHGVSHTAINKRAKAEGWVKDLKAKIKAKAEEKVSKAVVSSQVSTETRLEEKQIIEANATVIANIRLEHRKDIAKQRSLTTKLFEEIEHQTINLELYEQLGALCHAPDDKGQDKRYELFTKVIGTSSRVDSAKKLAETLKTLIALEREAYALDTVDKTPDNPIDDLSDDEIGARIISLLTAPAA